MKNLIIILSLLAFCKAPAQVIKSLYDDENGEIEGAYYKDTHNDLDNYVGTWIYTNGTTSLTIKLVKKEMQESSNASYTKYYYEDILVGEYQYIENGIQKINTLSQLLLDLPDTIDYNISGNAIIGPQSIYCDNCSLTDRKILLFFSEPNRNILGYDPKMIFERIDSGGIQKLKLIFWVTGHLLVEEGVEPQYTNYTVPFGEYILIKQ